MFGCFRSARNLTQYRYTCPTLLTLHYTPGIDFELFLDDHNNNKMGELSDRSGDRSGDRTGDRSGDRSGDSHL